MSRLKHNQRNPLSRSLVIAALVTGGTLQFIAPVMANTGGIDIVNRATATYNDGTTGGPTYNTTSNTVTIRVREVAGITIDAAAPSNTAPKPGEKLYVDFTITNAGFDPTQFFIPDTATLSNTADFKIDGPLIVMSVNGAAQNGTTGIAVPTGGAATGDTSKFTFTGAGAGGSIPVGSTVVVRVPIEVLGSATTTSTLEVSLGETDPVDTDNLVRVNSTKDVYTVDNPDSVAGEYPGTPVDTREAMDTSAEITVAARFQAFASVLKANGGYDNNSTPNNLADDELTYNLALKVENPSPSPSPSLAPSDLYGTAITVDTISVNRVLISDAIPAGTELGNTADISRGSNTNWQIVYTTDPLIGASAKTALEANWVTVRPASGITRVGFIYNTDASPTGNGPVAKGTTLNGFTFKVKTLSSFTGGQIANIAQVFGQSQPGTPAVDTATQIVYDESGDQDTNNNLVGANPEGINDAVGGITYGVADPTKDGIDPGTGTDPTAATTNTGTDPATGDLGGETTVYTIASAPFTGPDGAPEAEGPNPDPDKNKDYTNQSIVLPAGLDPATALNDAQTPEVVFENTVKNVSAASQAISLIPTLPASFGTNEAALPNGSTVTIDPDGAGSLPAVTYTYSGGSFTTTGAAPSVVIPAGGSQDYTVTVNLPSGAQLTGYPVVINAFVDGDGNGVLDANEPSNQTIDRYYTGYVRLLKDARILETDGSILGTIPNFTTDSALLGSEAQPGRIIEYRIRYENISVGSASDPAGNKSLSANDLTIVEDGDDGTNTWFQTTVERLAPVVNGNGSLIAPSGSAVTLTKTTNGTVANDIEVYTVDVGTVAPGGSGEMTFERKIKQ